MKIRSKLVRFDRAEPETFWNIFIYLVTAGKHGSVFKAKTVEMREWFPPIEDHSRFNCRSITGRFFDDED